MWLNEVRFIGKVGDIGELRYKLGRGRKEFPTYMLKLEVERPGGNQRRRQFLWVWVHFMNAWAKLAWHELEVGDRIFVTGELWSYGRQQRNNTRWDVKMLASSFKWIPPPMNQRKLRGGEFFTGPQVRRYRAMEKFLLDTLTPQDLEEMKDLFQNDIDPPEPPGEDAPAGLQVDGPAGPPSELPPEDSAAG